jgi:CubicO group peptidase (beta-lactamase class C family)
MKVVEQHSTGTAFTVVPARTPITIRHVLTHTSGLQSGGGLLAAQYDTIAPRTLPNDTTAAFLKRLAALPLNFEPGTKWEYGASGNGLAVAARLIEVISKQSLDQFLSERILGPLKMNDTYFYLPEEKLTRFASLYRPGPDNRIQIAERPDRDSPYFRERTYFSGTGGLATTAVDYLQFQQMLLNGGELNGARILGRKTVELMTSNHIGNLFVPNRGAGVGFGLGVSVVTDVGASAQLGSVGTFGWGGATGTITFVDPVEDMIGIMLTQLRPYAHLNIRQDFQTLAYQALVSNAPASRSSN